MFTDETVFATLVEAEDTAEVAAFPAGRGRTSYHHTGYYVDAGAVWY